MNHRLLVMGTLLLAASACLARHPANTTVAPAQAGAPSGGGGLLATRQDLVAEAVQLEKSGTSEDRRQAAEIRTRLQNGDFNVGDRILLNIEGEKDLSDTFTVAPGRQLPIADIGDIPLQGVLRSELEPYLTRRLAETLRDPIVHAKPFLRLSVQGAVMKPGYYGVPSTALLSDPVMIAGGTVQDANVHNTRIERAGHVLYGGQELQDAIAQGKTIDEMGIRPGDQFIVPTNRHIHVTEIAALLAIPITLYELSHIF